MSIEQPTSDERTSTRPRRALVEALLAGLAVFVLVLATAPMLPITWDEGNAVFRSDWMLAWTRAALGEENPQIGDPWTAEGIARGWRFVTQFEGHPSFYAVVISAGRTLGGGRLHPLTAARLGPIALFALAAGAMYWRLNAMYGRVTAAASVVVLLALPRLFAHAHTASFDGPLTSCWILAWATFEPACRKKRWIVLWAVCLGACMSCKFTGWTAPIGFLAWALLYRRRGPFLALAIGLPLAVGVFYLLNPPLWLDPLNGMRDFFFRNFSRGEFNIAILFLGRMYNLDHPLPWWNTLFWTGVTVPVGFLLLFGVGGWSIWRRRKDQPEGVLLVAMWAVLMVIRALPVAPPHDGVRLFLPSFAFLAMIAAVGVGALWRWEQPPRRRIALRAAVVLLLLGNATSVAWYAPHWLSYYNAAIGGLHGATRAGMEPTYYWDGLDRETLGWLNEHAADGDRVCFAAASGENLYMLKRWGEVDFVPCLPQEGPARFYVVQHRPSGWSRTDRSLLMTATPLYRHALPDRGVGPWRLRVPLVSVYSMRDLARAEQEQRTSGKTPPIPIIAE